MPTSLDRDGVQELLERDAQLVDVLGARAYEQEHIPGAINIPLAELPSRVERLRHDASVVVYCADSL